MNIILKIFLFFGKFEPRDSDKKNSYIKSMNHIYLNTLYKGITRIKNHRLPHSPFYGKNI